MVVDAGPPIEVLVLGPTASGVATKNTPEPIAFYLDQAYRARSRGAYTAAAAIYRVALAQFLGSQGFTQGRLQARIDAAIAASPPWLVHLDEQLMHALRRLGNQAVHPDTDDISKQAVFDHELGRDLERLFVDLLDEVFEIPAHRAARRQKLLAAREQAT